MIIKKYQAKTEYEAMNLAKAELGDSCVCLNVKQVKQKGIKKLFKSPFVEVTVALEENRDSDFETNNKAAVIKETENPIYKSSGFNLVADDSSKINNESLQKEISASKTYEKNDILSSKNKIDSLTVKVNETDYEDKNIEPQSNDNEVLETGIDTVYDLISQTLIDNEVDEDYVDEIIDDAKSRLKNNTPMDVVLSHIYQKLILRFGEPQTIKPSSNGPMVIFFVGTTGVGKTTTIAKIASKLYVQGSKVALFTSDTYRIAAAEQLRSYANIMNVPFRIIYTIEDFEEGLEAFSQFDYILVDTVGHSHKNEELKADMKKFIDFSKEKAETEVYLVLAASTKMKDLIYISDSYSEISDYRLIFT